MSDPKATELSIYRLGQCIAHDREYLLVTRMRGGAVTFVHEGGWDDQKIEDLLEDLVNLLGREL